MHEIALYFSKKIYYIYFKETQKFEEKKSKKNTKEDIKDYIGRNRELYFNFGRSYRFQLIIDYTRFIPALTRIPDSQ